MMSDEEAIRRKLVEVCDTLDTGDWEGFAELFTPDAVYAVPAASAEIRGSDAIRAWISKTYHWVDTGRHVMVNPMVTVDSDRATVTSEVVFFIAADDGPKVGLIGRYDDVFHRTDGWRIARRESVIHESWMAPALRENLP